MASHSTQVETMQTVLTLHSLFLILCMNKMCYNNDTVILDKHQYRHYLLDVSKTDA